MKVINCIKLWLKKYWSDDWSQNQVLQNKLEVFLEKLKLHSETPKSEKLVKMIEDTFIRKRNEWEKRERRATIASMARNEDLGPPLRFRLESHFEPLAAALTEKFNEVFVKIRPREFLKQAWKKQDKMTK